MAGPQSANTNQAAGQGNLYADAGGAGSRSRLEMGVSYDGVITAANPSKKSYTVTTDEPDSMVVEDVILALPVISALLGFRMSFQVPVGTAVSIVAGSPSFIYACKPSGGVPPGSPRSATHMPDTDLAAKMDQVEEAMGWLGHDQPNDMVEGEFEIANLLGVAITLLTGMARLQAGDRAKVECLLTRDMVRVVSDQFHHMSSFGDIKILEKGGRINVEEQGTSYEHENWGALDQLSPKGTADGVSATSGASIAETGRWRFKRYIGFLGDFLHTFITDPAATLGSMAAQLSGKSRIWRGGDGTILLQSIAEIGMERVCRVQVPIQLASRDVPDGNTSADFKTLEQKFLTIWDFGKGLENMPVACFQLREYARWLSEFHSFARFHQLSKDWSVPATADCPAPSWSCGEADKEKANASLQPQYYDCYSTMRILRDGGQLNFDSYGNCVCTGKHGVHISSTRDMVFEAAGDMRFVVGQNLYMMARRSIEIIAAVGSLVLKARTAWKALCEWGSVYIKSDHDPLAPKTKADQPFPTEDPAPEIMDASIVIDAPLGSLAVQTKDKLSITSEEKDIHIQALKESILIGAKEMLSFTAPEGRIGVTVKHTVWNSTDDYLMDTKLFDLSKAMTFRKTLGKRSNVLSVTDLRASRICARDVFSKKMGPAPVAEDQETGKPHVNHVEVIKTGEDYEPKVATEDDRLEVKEYNKDFKQKRAEDKFFQNPLIKKTRFTLLPQSEYVHAKTPLYQTLSQQKLTLDDPPEGLTYETWEWASNQLTTARRTAPDRPHVGSKNTHLVCSTDVGDPGVPSSRAPNTPWKPTPLKPSVISIKFLKHSS